MKIGPPGISARCRRRWGHGSLIASISFGGGGFFATTNRAHAPPPKSTSRNHEDVVLGGGADVDQDLRDGGEFRRHAGVESGETGDHIDDKEDDERDDQDDQDRRVHEREQDLLAYSEREFLVRDVAFQDLTQAAALFARHDGGDVDLREDALLFEGIGKLCAAADFVTDGLDIGSEFRVGEAVSQEGRGLSG